MKRNGLTVLLVAAVSWVAVAIVLGGSGSLSGSHSAAIPSGPSPACLPRTSEYSAALAGTAVDVSPTPGTDTANPHTQISFLGAGGAGGIPIKNIRDVSVEGSKSGYHYGRLHGYSQGDGASFVPDKPFDAGERVVVRATIGRAGGPLKTGRRVGFSFRVATPYPTEGNPPFPNPPAPAADVQSFNSAPDLHPPILTVTAPDRDPSAGDVLLTVGPGPGQYGPLIYTTQGRLIWFDRLPDGIGAEDLGVQTYEGQRDLTWWQGQVLSLGFGQGEDVVANSHYQRVATIHGGNGLRADLHDFQLAGDDVAYITVYNPIRCDLAPLHGARNGVLTDSAVQEIDVKTGLVRWEWHALDHVGVGESHAPVPTTAQPWDWFHLNSIDVEGAGSNRPGDLLVSGRSTWTAYQLQRGSGRILWRLGGTRSSFRLGPGAATVWQHDARLLPDGTVTFFDNGANPRVHFQSRGVRVVLNYARHEARLRRAYTHPTSPLLATSQGNMQTLPDRSVLIGWGAMPSVSELSAGGELRFDAHMPPGMSSYRAYRFPWVGRPVTRPAVSARALPDAEYTAVYASWNGATEVASWRVLAGSAPATLRPRTTIPDSGFESSTVLPEAYPDGKGGHGYVSVQALGARGQLLATSPTVAVRAAG